MSSSSGTPAPTQAASRTSQRTYRVDNLDLELPAAKVPTLYFIGVTTGNSSIRRVFPAWAEFLGLGEVELVGIDLGLHAEPELYRKVVAFIRDDPRSLGALVTTHKLDLYAAAQPMFNVIDPHASAMAEVSSISKANGMLVCHAKDPISSGLAIEAFLPPDHFAQTGADLVCLGAGGSSIAITWYLTQPSRADNRPNRTVVTNRSAGRLDHLREVHRAMHLDVPVEYVLSPSPAENAAVLAGLAPGSVVVNATGLGKDAPGSPLPNGARWPAGAIAWDLNYRGDLIFLDQARAAAERGVHAVDGWVYFLHGWTQVIAEVFHIDIPTSGPVFDNLSEIAVRASRS